MTGLSRDAMTLIAASRSRYHLAARDKARIRRKLMQRIGLGVVAGSLLTAGAASVKAAQSALPLTWLAWGATTAKVLGILVLAGATTVGGVAAFNNLSNGSSASTRTARTRSAVRSATLPAERNAPVVGAPSAVAEVVRQPESTLEVAEPVQNFGARTVRVNGILVDPINANSVESAGHARNPIQRSAPGADARLLNQADAIRTSRRALQRGDARTALDLLDRAIPFGTSGDLEQEALYVRVNANCLQGNVSQARRFAEALLARFPASVLAAKIRGSCAFGSKAEP